MAAGNALQRWEMRTANVGGKWQANSQGKGAAVCEGLARAFPGVNVSACMSTVGTAYDQGVAATSAQGFQASISGKGQKWLANTVAGINGQARAAY